MPRKPRSGKYSHVQTAISPHANAANDVGVQISLEMEAILSVISGENEVKILLKNEHDEEALDVGGGQLRVACMLVASL